MNETPPPDQSQETARSLRFRTSVLVNNFNHAAYLPSCIDSVLNQDPPADEIILYDDGSTDESVRVLEAYGRSITVIRGEHGQGTPMENQAAAIDAAFRASTGEIIFLLDADDAFGPGKIAAYLKAFAASLDVVMVQAPMWRIDGTGKALGLEYDSARHAANYIEHIYRTNDLNIYYPTSALAFRRSYLEQRLPLDMRTVASTVPPFWADGLLTVIAPHFGQIVTLREPQTCWRRHGRSLSRTTKSSAYFQFLRNAAYHNRYCRSRGLKPIKPWRSRRLWRLWFRHICPEFLLNRIRRLRRV